MIYHRKKQINLNGWKKTDLPKYFKIIRRIFKDNLDINKFNIPYPPATMNYYQGWEDYKGVERDCEIGSSWLIDYLYRSSKTVFNFKGYKYEPDNMPDNWPLFWGSKDLFSKVHGFPTPRYTAMKLIGLLSDYRLVPDVDFVGYADVPEFKDRSYVITTNEKKNRLLVLVWNYMDYLGFGMSIYKYLIKNKEFSYVLQGMTDIFRGFELKRMARIDSSLQNNAWAYLMDYFDEEIRDKYQFSKNKMKYIIEVMDEKVLSGAKEYMNIFWEPPEDLIYVDSFSVQLLEYKKIGRKSR
jgi:hypothetical protein